MRALLKIAIALFLFTSLGLTFTWADEVVMANGERFTSSNIWEEGTKIRFTLQGLVVSANKADVAEIIRDKTHSSESAQQAPSPTPSMKKTAPAALPPKISPTASPQPTATPAPKPTPQALPEETPKQRTPNASDQQSAAKVKGIGLEGVVWRMAPKQLTGLKKVESAPALSGIEQYWRPDQPLQFVGAPLDGVVYGFWQEQLYTITMWADGHIGYQRLKQHILAHFGPGTQRKPEVERYIWDEPETQRMLEFDEKSKSGIFVMRSSELDAVIKKQNPTSSNHQK